jgi:TPR repeat protein
VTTAPTIDALNAMSAEDLAARLSGPPEERAALVRAAAEAGVAEAQAVYGQMLLDGAGVGRDQREALRWFSRAAAAGHVIAINMVGRCYDLGWGVAIDKARAVEWYRAAAHRGLDWGMYNYATLLALGHGIDQDRTAALSWLRQAAALGNAKAINFVGSFHEDGWVVDRDMATAAEYYRQAAEGGDFRGQFNHARMLIDAGDIAAAILWLRRLPETATPAFLGKVREWLRGTARPDLHAVADELGRPLEPATPTVRTRR